MTEYGKNYFLNDFFNHNGTETPEIISAKILFKKCYNINCIKHDKNNYCQKFLFQEDCIIRKKEPEIR